MESCSSPSLVFLLHTTQQQPSCDRVTELRMSARYARLSDESHHDDEANGPTVAINVSDVMNPIDSTVQHEKNSPSQSEFKLRLLHKEKVDEIEGINEGTTILELKSLIEAKTGVKIPQQRLIHAGKQLKPDGKDLKFFKILNNSTIHLFPIPEHTPVVANAQEVNSDGITATRMVPLAVTANMDIPHQPIHFDPFISQSTREVKLWCFILIFLSSLTLVNNLSFILSTGQFGNNILDSFVTLLDTVIIFLHTRHHR